MPIKNGITSESRLPLSEPAYDAVATAPVPAAAEASVLSRLLRMADSYWASNMPWQALEIYWEIVEENPEEPEAAQARQRLLAICEQYEREGKLHHARAMYQRMMKDEG